MADRPVAAKAIKATSLHKQAKTDLPASVFGEEFHESLVHDAARADLAARRRGTASTLGRGEVSMTGAKAWRQKGTGRARAGALSSPTRRGGGAAFGPKPRTHGFKVNRKARRRALRSALSVHAARDSIAVLDPGKYKEPSTKTAAEALTKWGPKAPTLVIVDPEETAVAKSFRNLPRVSVIPAGSAGVADVIGFASIVVSPAALEVLEARSAEVTRGSGGESAPEKPQPAADPDTPGRGAEDVSGDDSDTPGREAEDVSGDGSDEPTGEEDS